MPQQLRGSGGAAGVAIGPAYLHRVAVGREKIALGGGGPAEARAQFAEARQRVEERLGALAARLHGEQRAEEAQIFEAQSLLAADPSLEFEVFARIDAGLALPEALAKAIAAMRAVLESLDDQYLRERAADVGAIGSMLLQALHGDAPSLADLPAGVVLVAPDLTPAETVDLPAGRVAGFVTAYGGPTGHTAILARSLGIPAVVGAGEAALAIADETILALDGEQGLLLVDPDAATLARYQQRHAELLGARERQRRLVDLPGTTADGQLVPLWANIGRPEEARLAREAGAEGIGLFRTEFLFLYRDRPPSQDEQLAAYREVLDIMDGRPVVARTLDIGGDKPLPYLPQRPEPNPFLGVRGLRFCMQHVELFQSQLRALLRAAVHGDLWLMLPMVATLDDLAWGKQQIHAAAEALAAANLPHRADLPVGMMVETPSAAINADLFAPEVNFFSIGSNDLTQYTLAADRGDGELARRYDSDDPAVWRLIEQTITAGAARNIPVGICGDLGGNLEAAVALTGLGIGELSMAPAALLGVRERLRQVTLAEAREAGRRRLRQA
jgi:phosphotransferase system enzyme I (PtsI)